MSEMYKYGTFTLEEINELAMHGWRVHTVIQRQITGQLQVLLEKKYGTFEDE